MRISDIQGSRLFSGMSEEDISKCLSDLDAKNRSYKKGELVLNAGERAYSLGMVITGSLTIESNDVWGNCTVLSLIGPGDYFAETYALLNEVMLVDVRANEDSSIVFFNIRSIMSINKKSSSWKEKLLKNILIISARKNLMLSQRSFYTSPKSCRARLLSYLNAVALKTGKNEFDIPFNRQQLADYLNLERTNMSKELSRMQDEGIIRYRMNHFKLL